MKEQVNLAVDKDWNDIKIDKQRLVEEHSERELEFWKQFKLLESNSQTVTNWGQIRELKSRMNKEIKTKA